MDFRRRLVAWMLGIACVLAWISPRVVSAAAAEDTVCEAQGRGILPARRDGIDESTRETPEDADDAITRRVAIAITPLIAPALVRGHAWSPHRLQRSAATWPRGPPHA